MCQPLQLALISLKINDPRNKFTIIVDLNNQNIIDYDELTIKLDSNLIKESIITPLGPKEQKTLQVDVTLDPMTRPQNDNLLVTLHFDNKSIINPQVHKYQISEYVLDRELTEKKGFLSATSSYEITSNNVEYSGDFRVETTLINSIFSSEKPKASLIKEGDKRYFVWELNLEGNTAQVSVRKNFVPLFVVLVLLVALGIIYLLLRSPVLMIKEAGNQLRKEGGIVELSVIVHVRNRGQKKLEDIEITDLIPSLATVEREVSIGSLQPTKILTHDKKKHTVVKWHINSLDGNEERVLTYKLKSKLAILGTFNLPASTGVFKLDKKTLTTSSNVLQVGE